jgi:ketosteroid isomerase-like protein
MTPDDADIVEVKRLDKQWAEDATRSDAVGLGRLLAEDLRYVHSNGAIDTKQSLIAAIASRSLVYIAIDSEDVDARFIGDAVVLTNTTRLRVNARGSEQNFQARFLRVYVRGSDGWKLTVHQGTRLP